MKMIGNETSIVSHIIPLRNFSLDRFTTHDAIPKSEIWIKLNGDKGGLDTYQP